MTDFIERVKALYKRDKDYWQDIYKAAEEDLYFQSDEEDAQWDSEALTNRRSSNRPTLTIDQLRQYTSKVINDIRSNTPEVKVIPAKDADEKKAEIIQEIIRNIFYVSKADTCFDIAAAYQVKSSFGFIEVDHQYVDDDGFEQELVVLGVNDPHAIILDSDSVAVDGSDAKHYFKEITLSVEDFKEQYRDFDPESFEVEGLTCGTNGDDELTLLQFCVIEETERKIGLKADGTIEDYQAGVDYQKTRTVSDPKIKKYILSGKDILEETDFVGKYIPIVPVYGDQYWVRKKRYIDSLIRHSKDAQRMFNCWKSLETELLLKQPNAPFIAQEGTIENYKDMWMDPNSSAVLLYKGTDVVGNPAKEPRRLEPPVIPTGVVNASRSTIDDIKATMGMYGASLGERTNEVSGVAIDKRSLEGDMSTYHFIDNLNKSITQVTKILVNAIPDIYDTPRTVRAIDGEDRPRSIGINGDIAENQKETYDLTQGSYDCRVVQGAPFSTQRQEASEFFNRIVASNPELMPVMGDLLFKYMDFAGANVMSKRMERFIDPKFAVNEDEQEDYDPQKEQLKAIIAEGEGLMNELMQSNEVLAKQLEDKQAELQIKATSEQTKAQAEVNDKQVDEMKLALEREKNNMAYDLKIKALELKRKELEMRELERKAELNFKYEELEAETVESMANTLSTQSSNNLNNQEDIYEPRKDGADNTGV